MKKQLPRRRVLALTGTAAATGLAGCAGIFGGDDPGENSTPDGTDTDPGDDTGTPTDNGTDTDPGETPTEEPPEADATVVVNDQESRGESFVLAEAETDTVSSLVVRNENDDVIGGGTIGLNAGESVSELEVPITEPLMGDTEITVQLVTTNDYVIAEDTAMITLPATSVGFAEQPTGGDEAVTVRASVAPSYELENDHVSIMVFRGENTEAGRERLELLGSTENDRFLDPGDKDVREILLDTEKNGVPLQSGEKVTVALVDGFVVEKTTVTIE